MFFLLNLTYIHFYLFQYDFKEEDIYNEFDRFAKFRLKLEIEL